MAECEDGCGDDGAVATWRLITGAVLVLPENKNQTMPTLCKRKGDGVDHDIARV